MPNYNDISRQFLKDRDWNSVDGQMYGIPHGRGANLLMYNTDKVTPAPTPGARCSTTHSPYKGKVTAYDSPIYIADAALYLMKTKPDLGIKNPYALDEEQFDAAVDLLKKQKENHRRVLVGLHQGGAGLQSGDSVIGTTWQVIANLAQAEKVPVETVLPEEGSTGWSDTWMVSSKAKHPNCAYKWMDYIISPRPTPQVAEYFGEAPANTKACDMTADKNFCDTYHADRRGLRRADLLLDHADRPSASTAADVTCTDYAEWTQAWTEIKG